jgi:hypothetical protein
MADQSGVAFLDSYETLATDFVRRQLANKQQAESSVPVVAMPSVAPPNPKAATAPPNPPPIPR